MKGWGGVIARALLDIMQGKTLRDSIMGAVLDSSVDVDMQSPLHSLYLALKYGDLPERGLIANTMCGGDNAGRGAVLGALLGAAHTELITGPQNGSTVCYTLHRLYSSFISDALGVLSLILPADFMED